MQGPLGSLWSKSGATGHHRDEIVPTLLAGKGQRGSSPWLFPPLMTGKEQVPETQRRGARDPLFHPIMLIQGGVLQGGRAGDIAEGYPRGSEAPG